MASQSVRTLAIVLLLSAASWQGLVLSARAAGPGPVLALDLGTSEGPQALRNAGIPECATSLEAFCYDLVSPAAFRSEAFASRGVIYVGWTEGATSDSISALYARSDDIAAFVASGGGLVAFSEYDAGQWTWIPGGSVVTYTAEHADDVRLTAAGAVHPVMAGQSDGTLSGWGNARHNYFQSWPTYLTVLATDSSGSRALDLAGTFGSGKVYVAGQDPDWHSSNGGNPGATRMVSNSVRWATGTVGPAPPACRDGVDNDGDGAIDFPADPGCSSAEDDDETDAPPACRDGVDNDGDGAIDFPADPGCSSAEDDDEMNAPPVDTRLVDLEERSAGTTRPGTSTPRVENRTFTTPSATLPASCSFTPCREPTNVPSQRIATPFIAPVEVTTPALPVDRLCTPLVCVGPFTVPSQRVGPTPAVDPVVIDTPSERLPSVCTVAGAACVGPFIIPEMTLLTTPPVEPQQVTPPITVGVQTTRITGDADPRVGESTAFGPVTVLVPVPLIGDVPVTLCPATCPAPASPTSAWRGSVTVAIGVGDTTHVVTVPLDLDA